jgi:RimJ/RimL family protein N-acetyltransferase
VSGSDPAEPDARVQLQTLFVLDGRGRIMSTREPTPLPGPAFMLIRGTSQCAWATRGDVPQALADDLETLAAEESAHLAHEAALTAWRQPPRHERAYSQMLGAPPKRIRSGPAFAFPENPGGTGAASQIKDESLLARHFTGWVPGEIAAGRAPVMGICDEEGYPVSVCFCARRYALAAEAGVETATAFRGRGYAGLVTAAWAAAVRAMGLLPLYSTNWHNAPSLAVARKLGLTPYATDWSIE